MPIKIFNDIFYAVIYTTHSIHVDFTIYPMVGIDNHGTPLFTKVNPDGSYNEIESTDGALQLAHGFVKWDGCSNWTFDEDNGCMLHRCTRNQLLEIGEILARCFDIARDELPNFIDKQ